MTIPSSFLPAPGRLFLPGCAVAAGLLAVSSPVFADPAPKTSAASPAALAPRTETVRVGKTTSLPLPKLSVVRVEDGFANIFWEAKNETLTIKALSTGTAKIRIESPHRAPQIVRFNLVSQAVPNVAVTREGLLQIVDPTQDNGLNPSDPTFATTPNSANTGAQSTASQAPGSRLVAPGATNSAAGAASIAGTGGVASTVPSTIPNTITGAMPNSAINSRALTVNEPRVSPRRVESAAPLAPSLPVLGTRATRVSNPSAGAGSNVGATPRVSDMFQSPGRGVRANVAYPTIPRAARGATSGRGQQSIDVTQGMARVIKFPNNILAVYFSDPNVMDARAINARNIAVTGVGPGPSTLAVFTSRFPNDAVGRAYIYRIQTMARGGQTVVEARSPRAVERTIVTALGDPRVRTAIISLPDGSLAARLSGTVRSEAEVQAALTTAKFFVPQVISSLYSDINAPTLEAVLSGASSATPETNLQADLRRITGNNSIELVSLPSGLAFKAEVNSAEEAQALLRVLPGLNQQVIPFIVIRGQDPSSSPYFNSTVPQLNGEDRQLTQKMHDVTGINTVYVVRTASNGLACYGSVPTRSQYNTVRRFMLTMAQSASPAAFQGTSQGGATLRPQGREGTPLPAYDPQGGYTRNIGMQMFVRITDPGQSVIRKVTVETSIVEISRTALKNLGIQYGTVSLLSENASGGTTTVVDGAPVTTPLIVTRTIDPTFNQGAALGGNGLVGGQSFRAIDPFRVRLNALVNNGDARILSRPNVTAVEGASAQITIGGERPIPIVKATQGAISTEITFRRYGVIISMRPTVTGENTILLQIRADITQPDSTFGINLNNSLIPGEVVRSVDTTLNVRPGDTVVMGGLITNEKRQQMSKVPILGDLPVIGSLFRSKRFDNNETELAIFMSPRIESMPADMESLEDMNRIPSFPELPSRQEADSALERGSAVGG